MNHIYQMTPSLLLESPGKEKLKVEYARKKEQKQNKTKKIKRTVEIAQLW